RCKTYLGSVKQSLCHPPIYVQWLARPLVKEIRRRCGEEAGGDCGEDPVIARRRHVRKPERGRCFTERNGLAHLERRTAKADRIPSLALTGEKYPVPSYIRGTNLGFSFWVI